MKTIYFVRHGESQANVDKVFAGSGLDSPLTKRGQEQADRIALALRDKPFEVIVSSPLRRAKTTAERIAKQLDYSGKIVIEPLLTERDFGTATGKTWAEVDDQIDKSVIDGLETTKQLAARMQQLLTWLASLKENHVLVVGHGTAEAMLRTVYVGQPHHSFLETKELGNAEIREYFFR